MDSPTLERDPDCERCKLCETAQYVCLLGYGNTSSDVMIVGEAPGEREDDSGRPFVGRSGKLLRRILEEHGFTDETVFITNAVSCRPPGNRTPKASEIKRCKYWLDYQMEVVKPRYVLLLGNIPLQSTIGVKGITNYRGKPVEVEGIIYFPTFHPASVFHDPSKQQIIEADIQTFSELVNGGQTRKDSIKYTIVENETELKQMLKALKGAVSFDIETNCLYPWDKDAKVRAFGFGVKGHQWIIYTDDWLNGELRRIIRKVNKKLNDCYLIMQNGKFDSLWMRVHSDVDWRTDFDTMLAHYMIDENSRHGLKFLSTLYFGAPDYDIKAQTAPRDELCEYLAKDLFYTRKLKFIFNKMLKKEPHVKAVFDKILMPCAQMFVDVEYNGVFVDVEQMGDAEIYLRDELAKAKKKLDKFCSYNPIPGKNEEMNWGSPKQVAYLLFNKLKLDVVETTKTGNPSTAEGVLKQIDHPLMESLLKYRGAKQQLSFFIEGWKPYLVDRRLHPSFKLHGTVTGRLSCENPNLQQVPRDTRIRSLITAPPGWVLVEADLSQIEMRIAAELSGERNLLDAFYNKKDVHWKTAIRELSRGAGMPELVIGTIKKHTGKKLTYGESVEMLLEIGHNVAIEINRDWKEIRKKAKAINFGFLFGMWWKKFKRYAFENYGLRVTEEEAKAAYDAYFDLYPRLKEWHERQKRFACRNGYVVSLSGRKRRLPEATSEHVDFHILAQAINSPVQSFANEINLMAAIEFHETFSPDEFRIVGTVHDAVLAWVRKNRVKIIVPKMLQIMSHPKLFDELGIKLRVPIEAEASIGPWGKGVSLEQWQSKSAKAA